MSFLSQASSNPLLKEYAQGRARDSVSKLAQFISPSVEVSAATGRFKKFTEKHRFSIPNTERAVGGAAVQLVFTREDGTFNCTPNALDAPVDVSAGSAEDAQAELKDAADEISAVAALSHEKKVIDLALSGLTNTDIAWAGDFDPKAFLDAKIAALIKASGFGGNLSVRVVFGAGAWLTWINHPNIRKNIIVSGGRGAAVGLALPTEQLTSDMLFARPEIKTCMTAHDSTPQGVTANYAFLLDKQVLVFLASDRPTRRDPSFMKTFRLRGRWMVPGMYQSPDARQEVAKMDWSEDVQIANSAAAKLFTVTNATAIA
jgi:hypothetical protein